MLYFCKLNRKFSRRVAESAEESQSLFFVDGMEYTEATRSLTHRTPKNSYISTSRRKLCVFCGSARE